MTILIVMAHPDDEILGCGGIISKMTREGEEAYSFILGEGITSRYDQRDEADKKEMEQLHQRTINAAKVVGISRTFWQDLPDNMFDTVPLLKIVKSVESKIQELQPEIIFTHHSGDLNVDHAIVSRAVLTATRPVKHSPVKDIYACEIPSSTDWSFQTLEPVWRPNVFFDISQTLETKLLALKEYETEMRPQPHPRSYQNVSIIAQRWGSLIGTPAAEAFQLIRAIR